MGGADNTERPKNWKTVLCRHFQIDACKQGASCSFIREKGGLSPGVSAFGGPAQPVLPPPNAKTQLCRHFESAGICLNGIRCNFAHGVQELRGAGIANAAKVSASQN